MQLWVRCYNADSGILEKAVEEGLQVDGLMLDANIAAYFTNVLKRIHELGDGIPIAIDPNTAKIRSAAFRARKTYQRLPYFDGAIPSLRSLEDNAANVCAAFTNLQNELGATVLLSPYLLLEEAHFPDSVYVDVQRAWYEEFARVAVNKPVFFSLCVTVQALATPEGYAGVLDLLAPHDVNKLYLLLTDYDLGENRALDETVVRFLGDLRERGVQEILLGRGPSWVTLLASFGVTGYVTGINYMASLKREYFSREDEIGGITHNYYIGRRFIKATSAMAEQLIAEELVDECSCPVCRTGIPDGTNDIRRHYLFARSYESADVSESENPRRLVRGWVNETADLLRQADALEIDVIARPPVDQWVRFLA